MDTDKIRNVFVYGTLKRNESRANILKDNGAFWSCNTVVHGYMLHKGAFPALILEEKGVKVQGEIWGGVTPELLAGLDQIEGVPNHYHRLPIETINGAVAWIYVQPWDSLTDDSDLVPSGEWYGPMTYKMKFGQWFKNVGGANVPYSRPCRPALTMHPTMGVPVVQQKNPRKDPIWTGYGQPVTPPKPLTPWEEGGCIPGVALEWAGDQELVPEDEVKLQAMKGI